MLEYRCLVPESHDAILSRDSEEALWQTFFTAAPAQRRELCRAPNVEEKSGALASYTV